MRAVISGPGGLVQPEDLAPAGQKSCFRPRWSSYIYPGYSKSKSITSPGLYPIIRFLPIYVIDRCGSGVGLGC